MATRLSIRTDARIMADQENSTYPTDTAYNSIIDRAARRVWQRMITAGWMPDQSTFVMDASLSATGTFTFTEAVSTVNLVYPTTSATSIIPLGQPLRRLKPEERLDLLQFGTGGGVIAEAYELTQGVASGAGALATNLSTLRINLFPVPRSGFYLALYTRAFPGFTNDADVWTGPEGSDELIILMSAIYAAQKESDPGNIIPGLREQLKERYGEVTEAAGFMDAMGQQRIRDTNTRNYRPGDYLIKGEDTWL